MGDWVAALDGGGTKTAVAVASRRGEVALLAEGQGCNPQDGPGWDGVLREALGRAAKGRRLAAAALGIPGRGEVPAHDAAVDALLGSLLACPFEAMNDVALAHLGAFGGGDGVLVLSGTGSMAWARGPLGEARVGGWGDLIGDEGSAYWIGREALTQAARFLDGREQPHVVTEVRHLLGRLGSDAAGAFGPLAWLMSQPDRRAAIAGVARHVDAMAEQGFPGAQAILGRAGHLLGGQAKTAARRAGLLDHHLPWVPAGGMFRSAQFLTRVTDRMYCPPRAARLTALGGGLLRAAEQARWAPDAAWASKVDARLRAFA